LTELLNSNDNTYTRAYPDVLDEVLNEVYITSPLLFIIVVPFRVVRFQVYASGPAFLPLLGGTVGTNYLESRVERSTIVPKFQGHPENGAFETVTSFPERRRNRKWPDQASEGLGTLAMILVAQTCCTGKDMCADALSW
jgi:hypothetical protein